MNRTNVLIGLVAIAVIALGVAAYFVFTGGSTSDTTASAGPMAIILAKDDRTQGSKSAPLTVLEYAAPTCPHCAHFDMDVFPQFKRDYIDTGKVFFIFRVFPLNAVDVAAEAMARCLPEDNYFQFLDLLYRNQSEMGSGRLPSAGRSCCACRYGQDRGYGRAESRQLHRRSGHAEADSGRGRRRPDKIRHQRYAEFRGERTGSWPLCGLSGIQDFSRCPAGKEIA